MIECEIGPFGQESEMRSEVINDLRMVYYRGRFRPATAWSKVGRPDATDGALVTEADPSGKEETARRRPETRLSLEPAP
jgi:hypothetical protein